MHRLQVQIQVDQGVLDSLTFELPEAWTAGLQEDAGVRISYAQASQPGMVRVTFLPQQPFNPLSPILFSGTIPITPGQPLAVPNIRLLDEGTIERRLFLPDRLDDQAIVWSLAGLDPIDGVNAPDNLKQANANYQAYRIPGSQFQAIRLASKSAVGEPSVSMADVHIAWSSEAHVQGLAMFDLWPDGLDECIVPFPVGLRPVAIYVDETPIRLQLEPKPPHAPLSRQIVKLASNELPQRVRVVFASKTSDDAATAAHVSAPQLRYAASNRDDMDREIPVQRTLLTLYQLTPGELQLPGEAAAAALLDESRLGHYADVMEQATQLATDFTPQDLERWYTVWGRRFLTTQRRLQSMEPGGEEASTKFDEAVQQARQRHAGVIPQLKVDSVFQQLQLDTDLSDSTNVWIDALPAAAAVHYRMIPGQLLEQPLSFRPATRWSTSLRIAIALFVGLLGLALQRWPRYPGALSQWTTVACVLVGLGWWLWLEPSLLGWGIVGLSLVVTALLP